MLIGVKFCGGCNPRYNRKDFFERLISTYSQHQFNIADINQNYDLLIVIGGCSCCCADYSDYKYNHILKFWSMEQFPVGELI